MEPQAIYKNPRFLELADMIENHELAIEWLRETLEEEFPAPVGLDWAIIDNRPVLVGRN